jgi:hypothetical protein
MDSAPCEDDAHPHPHPHVLVHAHQAPRSAPAAAASGRLQRRIFSSADLAEFVVSDAHAALLALVNELGASVQGRPNDSVDVAHTSPVRAPCTHRVGREVDPS